MDNITIDLNALKVFLEKEKKENQDNRHIKIDDSVCNTTFENQIQSIVIFYINRIV
tara:strand:+ start:94 stop:261 length:168 start_codon:yes stop_codon:yes gene_type:complete